MAGNDFSVYPADRLPKPVARVAMVLAYLLWLLVTFGALRLSNGVVGRVVLALQYGEGSRGVHVVGRHGELSNGQRLPTDLYVMHTVAVGILTMAVSLIYAGVLAALGLLPPDRLSEAWKEGAAAARRRTNDGS